MLVVRINWKLYSNVNYKLKELRMQLFLIKSNNKAYERIRSILYEL